MLLGTDENNLPYSAIFNPDKNQLYNITALLSADSLTADYQFKNGELYELSNEDLSRIDLPSNNKVSLFHGISGYGFSEQAIYYLSGGKIIRNSLDANRPIILAENLPNFNQVKFFITQQNQIFILADNNLYSLSSKLNLIAPFVRNVKISKLYRRLTYATANEIDIYDLNTADSTLVSRTSTGLKEPQSFFDLGWVFYIGNGRLQNIEIDSRDHQNNYTFANVSENSSFYATANANYLILLDNRHLSEIQIR